MSKPKNEKEKPPAAPAPEKAEETAPGSSTAPAPDAEVTSQEAAPGTPSTSSEDSVAGDSFVAPPGPLSRTGHLSSEGSSAGDAFVSAFTPPAPSKQEPVEEFIVKNGPVLHNGVRYHDGQPIILNEVDGLRLYASGNLDIDD